jgi:predicted nuclease of predicted toxin-antitoxin system
MPLLLLLDENIPPIVAEQIAQKRPDIPIVSMHAWRDGEFIASPDHAVLTAAGTEGRTLVTYDTQILSELALWFEQEIPFAGLIFVDDKTIPGNDFGALMRALIYLWDRERDAAWDGRLVFLPAPR